MAFTMQRYLVEHVDHERTLRGLPLHVTQRVHFKVAVSDAWEKTCLRPVTAVVGALNDLNTKMRRRNRLVALP